MLIAGEASGDMHGADVVRCLLERRPDIEVFGIGGERLRAEGLRVVFALEELTGMGLFEILYNLRNVRAAYKLARSCLAESKPDLLILIDFPEFNLRLARIARRLRVPVLYYISPQVWAWRRYRIRQIATRVDVMAVVFPFEEELYRSQGVDVRFVGHPLLDLVQPTAKRSTTLGQQGLDPAKVTVTILPGSRKKEVGFLLAPMLEAAERLAEDMDAQFLLVQANTVQRQQLEEILQDTRLRIRIVKGDAYNALEACDIAWVASGTATLEAGLLKKPMIVLYRLSWFTYFLARLLVRVEHMAMVNILAGKRLVPELLQHQVTGPRIFAATTRILKDRDLYDSIVEQLGRVRDSLGSPGARRRVADIALGLMN